jgi:hypothetical protein
MAAKVDCASPQNCCIHSLSIKSENAAPSTPANLLTVFLLAEDMQPLKGELMSKSILVTRNN